MEIKNYAQADMFAFLYATDNSTETFLIPYVAWVR